MNCLDTNEFINEVKAKGIPIFKTNKELFNLFREKYMSLCGEDVSFEEWKKKYYKEIFTSRKTSKQRGTHFFLTHVTPVSALYLLYEHEDAPVFMYQILEPVIVDALRGKSDISILFIPVTPPTYKDQAKLIVEIYPDVCKTDYPHIFCSITKYFPSVYSSKCLTLFKTLCKEV